jgi:hypothetical protein
MFTMAPKCDVFLTVSSIKKDINVAFYYLLVEFPPTDLITRISTFKKPFESCDILERQRSVCLLIYLVRQLGLSVCQGYRYEKEIWSNTAMVMARAIQVSSLLFIVMIDLFLEVEQLGPLRC